MANYEFWYCDESGNRLSYISNITDFEYVKVVGDIGVLIFSLPLLNKFYEQRRRDRRIHVYRQPTNGALGLDLVVFLNEFRTITSTATNQDIVQLIGNDVNDLLRRRIVSFYAEGTEASKTNNADDMMKEIVTENMIDNDDYDTTTPDPTRSLSGINLTVQSDLSDGDSITKGFSWRNLLGVLQDIQATSKADGNEVFFGLVAATPTSLEFRTKTGQWGNNRTVSTGVNPVVFSQERGNLIDPSLNYVYTDEINKVYAGGQGQTTDRNIQTAQDDTRINESAVGLREGFASSSNQTDAAVSADAQDELARSRPKLIFNGSIADTPQSRYGLDWGLGDKCTVDYAGLQIDVVIRSVHVKVDNKGQEKVTAKIETVT